MTPTFPPLSLPDNLYPEYPKSWLGEIFFSLLPVAAKARKAHRILHDQLAYRYKNNINLGEHWSDAENLAIVNIISKETDELADVKGPWLPDDPFYLFVLLVDSVDRMQAVQIFMGIEWDYGCVISEEAHDTLRDRGKTVGDFVEVIKSSKKPKVV